MNLNLISMFLEMVDARSLSAAARRLNMTRSNISHQLKLLEREAGAQLLRRSTRSLELTQAGQILYEYGQRMMADLSTTRASIDHLGQSLRGHVRISVPTGFGRMYAGAMLLDFAKQHPGSEFDCGRSRCGTQNYHNTTYGLRRKIPLCDQLAAICFARVSETAWPYPPAKRPCPSPAGCFAVSRPACQHEVSAQGIRQRYPHSRTDYRTAIRRFSVIGRCGVTRDGRRFIARLCTAHARLRGDCPFAAGLPCGRSWR